jgi:hypothetical protein
MVDIRARSGQVRAKNRMRCSLRGWVGPGGVPAEYGEGTRGLAVEQVARRRRRECVDAGERKAPSSKPSNLWKRKRFGPGPLSIDDDGAARAPAATLACHPSYYVVPQHTTMPPPQLGANGENPYLAHMQSNGYGSSSSNAFEGWVPRQVTGKMAKQTMVRWTAKLAPRRAQLDA